MTKEKLIELFMFEPTNGKYLMSFEYRKQSYKERKPILNQLKKEGLLFERSKNRTTILFEYVPK